MVPVINVPIDLRACAGPQGGWMGGMASFMQRENYKHKFEGSSDLETNIRQAIERLYIVSRHPYYPQEDTFENDMHALNELYNSYRSYRSRQAATEPPVASLQRTNSWRGAALKPPPPPRPPPGFPTRPPAPSQAAPIPPSAPPPRAPPTTFERYIAQRERMYIRTGSVIDPQYKIITPTTPFLLFTLPNGNHQFYHTREVPPGAVPVDSVEYFLYEKR